MTETRRPTPVLLTIAGFDPTGGAGVTADLATFAAHGCQGVSVVTALTVQNAEGVSRVEAIPPDLLADQLDAILADIAVAGIKIGMLATRANVEVVASLLERHHPPNVVLDPVLRSTAGFDLLDADGVPALKKELLPRAAVITPNREEACELAGVDVKAGDAVDEAARRLSEMGAAGIVITGGDAAEPVDRLWQAGKLTRFAGTKIEGGDTHGTGCAFSSALAAGLAQGHDLAGAVERAKRYVEERIRKSLPDES